jgi:hypothetical protein
LTSTSSRVSTGSCIKCRTVPERISVSRARSQIYYSVPSCHKRILFAAEGLDAYLQIGVGVKVQFSKVTRSTRVKTPGRERTSM